MLWTRLILTRSTRHQNRQVWVTCQVNSSTVFKEYVDIEPVVIDDTLSYMPWEGDNNMPFDILKLLTSSLLLAIIWCTMIISELYRIIGWLWVAQAKKCVPLHHVRTQEAQSFRFNETVVGDHLRKQMAHVLAYLFEIEML